MSKKRGGGDFQNAAAKRFRNLSKVPTMFQGKIFEVLDNDITIILEQVSEYRHNKKPYPEYLGNAFANVSTALWFWNYVQEHVKVKKGRLKTDLTEDQVESLKHLLADAYSKSLSNLYSNQAQDFARRNEYISKAFVMLEPKLYNRTEKLKGLTEAGRRDLTIQIYGDPVYKFKYIHRKINDSTVSDKKKLKFLKKAYGDRYVVAVGAAMTTEGNGSDCLAMLFDDMMNVKKKKRGPFIQAYAEAYKKNGPSRYFRMDRSFYDKNKKLIKLLIGTKKHPDRALDIGYAKAFEDMKKGKSPEKRDKSKRQGDRKQNRNAPPFMTMA